MAVINTNVKALFSQTALKRTDGAMSKAMAQLSTGKRINTAADDAAGLAIATRMTHQIRSLNQAVRNAGDAINLIQTAEGATNEITDMMQRMRELAIQAVNDTNDNAQRSYLDLEFQQLKQEIVHISEATEWNGFPVLNGTAGERVGEMPVYKTTSVGQFGDVFINPTTLRTVSGADAGEVQKLTFTAPAAPAVIGDGTITVGGVSVRITSADTGSITDFTKKIKETLEADPSYNPTTSGRKIVQSAGELTITYAANDGDMPDIETDVRVTGVTTSLVTPTTTPAASATRAAITSATESFSSDGKFLKSGALNFSVDSSGTVSASFKTVDGKSITMKGTATAASGTVKFAVADGNNSQIISQDLTYTFKNSSGNTLAFTSRAVGLSIAVDGSIPALRAGDLRINGIDIGASYAEDDPFSPVNNAAGSAIAKAAAINRMAATTGVTTGESQTITLTGVPSAGTITVGGVAIQLTSAENTSVLAASKIAQALRNSSQFGASSGRVINYAPGGSTLSIDFPVAERNVPKTEVLPGTTGLSAIVDTTQEYTTMRPGTGVFAKVNENVFTGREMNASSSVSGTVFINGYASADITTVLNNTRATRQQVVDAINAIASKTGVKAIDTGYDSKGITLVAADGRNIEVRFETKENADVFGQRIGLREGVHSGTYSLESKIPTPVVISSATTGDIQRTGLIEGNFTKNESVFNTFPRETVSAPVAQVSAVGFTGSASAVTESYKVTINGTTFSIAPTTATDTPQALRDAMINEIKNSSSYATLGVTVSAGRTIGELLVTANTPGTPFTLSTTASATATSKMSTAIVEANQPSQAKALNVDDLMINGIKIRATTTADDTRSSSVAASSDPSASAIAIAAAINSQSHETGVRALANPVVSKGLSTVTSIPTTSASGTTYNLYVNGTTVPVVFMQDETGTARREKVVAAINARTGQHGVTASDNGSGVTLTSDGRNFSVWFDSNQKDLSAASFGLDKGGSAKQVSRISLPSSAGNTGDFATVTINGVTVTGTQTATDSVAVALKAAIDAKINSGDLKNIEVAVVNGNVEITSTVAGSPFTLTGAKSGATGTNTPPTVSLATVTPNSFGNNDVTGILNATATSTEARTLYSTVRLISDPALLPKLPSPDGAPPSDQLDKLKATGKPFEISVGDKGFSKDGNFAALGFQQGVFGGRASEDMDPPRVGRLAFQVGASANQYITIDLADFGKAGTITGEITGDVDLNVEDRRTRINTREGANAVLALLDTAMDKVNATRATMGAVMNRLEHVITNLSNVSTNLSASRSQIEDADYAKASTELAKTQIMQQAATAVLAQANTSQQTVLKLLGG